MCICIKLRLIDVFAAMVPEKTHDVHDLDMKICTLTRLVFVSPVSEMLVKNTKQFQRL